MDNFIIIETDIHLDGRREENYTNENPGILFSAARFKRAS